MKKKYSFEIIFKASIIIALSCLISQHIYGVGVEVYPEQIYFDYDSPSYEHDALTIRNANGGTADSPEWEPYYNRSNSIAYIKNQSSRRIQVLFGSNFEGTMHLIIKLTVTSGNGIGTVSNLFISNYSTVNFDYRTLNLTGTLPNNVGKQTFTWKWEIYAIPICATGYSSACKTTNTTHTYFTLLAAPLAPMEEPWVSVLDKACVWAGGQSTAEGVLASLTNSLYSSGVIYAPGSFYTIGSNTNLDLKSLLTDLVTPSNVNMDCRDFSNFLQVLNRGLGVACEYNRIWMTCNYNYILPAGWSSGSTGFWVYHQVGWYNSKVADSAAKVDNDDPTISPPFNGILVTGNWTLTEYLDKLTESIVSSVETGVCTVH